MELRPLADGVGVVRVGARIRENPTLRGNLQIGRLLDRGEHERRALVDHVVRIHQLGVRPADHPVARTGLPDLVRRQRLAAPRVRILRRHPAELRPQLADAAQVFARRLPCRDPQGLLEHRIHVGGPVQFDSQLSSPGHLHVLVETFGHRNRLVLAGPFGLRTACTQSCSGTPGFGPGDQHRVGAACLDVQARLIDQRLGDVAADAGVAGRGVLGAQPLCQQQSRIAVAPGQHVDDADRIDGLQHPWVRGGAGGRHHQVHGLHTRMVVVLIDLAVADEYRRPRVDGHGV